MFRVLLLNAWHDLAPTPNIQRYAYGIPDQTYSPYSYRSPDQTPRLHGLLNCYQPCSNSVGVGGAHFRVGEPSLTKLERLQIRRREPMETCNNTGALRWSVMLRSWRVECSTTHRNSFYLACLISQPRACDQNFRYPALRLASLRRRQRGA